MAKSGKNFLLVSLEEDKAKKLAQVISNDTCRKILDYLAKKEATETELAEQLNIPISTVHYNLKQLSESGLVTAEEFHYSKKGREINHYSLANKYIIIAPKSGEGIPSKLKTLLPVTLIIAGTAFAMQIFSKTFSAQYGGVSEVSKASAEEIAKAPLSYQAAPQLAQQAPAAASQQLSFIPWFVGGAVFSLIVYLLCDWLIGKLRK